MERHYISGKEEFKKVCQYLRDIFGVAKQFAKSINANMYFSTSHEWPTIEFYVERRYNSQKRYFVDKYIFLSIDDYKYPPIYKVWVVVSNSHGFKEIFEIIYSLFKQQNYLYKRLRWEKKIGYLDPPIDKKRLRDLLNEARQTIDNFDESELEKISNSNQGETSTGEKPRYLKKFKILRNIIVSILFVTLCSLMVFVYISSIIEKGSLTRSASFLEVTYSALWLGLAFFIYFGKRKGLL